MYMLSMISRGEETGYSLMQSIEEKTKGTWRPGPGTIYPLLRRLDKEDLIKSKRSKNKDRDSTSYSITVKGKKELEQMQASLVDRGSQGSTMLRFFAELLSPSYFIPVFLEHFPLEIEIFQEQVQKLPRAEKERACKEMSMMIKAQLNWIDSQLEKKGLEK